MGGRKKLLLIEKSISLQNLILIKCPFMAFLTVFIRRIFLCMSKHTSCHQSVDNDDDERFSISFMKWVGGKAKKKHITNEFTKDNGRLDVY